MEVTRRYWVAVALGVVGLLWAALLQQPLLLGGTVLIAAWLFTRQYRFQQLASTTISGLTITQQPDRTRVAAKETTLVRLTADLANPINGQIDVSAAPPTGSTTTGGKCTLAAGQQQSEATFQVRWPTAGQFTFGEPTVTISDSLGLFSQQSTVGSTPSVTVEPRAPRNIHVGTGGNQIATGFGEHEGGPTGRGLTPAEVRKYVAGDSAKQIDWKATARLNEPHVREFEAETDLETNLFVDHRAVMGTGPAGETKLDFARQIALALVESAQELGDPLGWYAVGDSGLTDRFTPSTTTSQYRTITRRLQRLEPTDTTQTRPHSSYLDSGEARRLAAQLDTDSPFDTALRPFFSDANIYVQRIEEQPLFGSLRMASAGVGANSRTVIITDDTNRTELREAVKLGRRGDGQVVVFLTPTVLYEQQHVRDLDDAYQRYNEFEAFRQGLASLSRVSAFEVGPRDRLLQVLPAERQVRRADQ